MPLTGKETFDLLIAFAEHYRDQQDIIDEKENLIVELEDKLFDQECEIENLKEDLDLEEPVAEDQEEVLKEDALGKE